MGFALVLAGLVGDLDSPGFLPKDLAASHALLGAESLASNAFASQLPAGAPSRPVESSPGVHAQTEIEAQVVGVLDDETIEVAVGAVTYCVRYLLVDAPESGRIVKAGPYHFL